MVGAVVGDGDAVDVFHSEEWFAGVGDAAIEEVCDEGMDQGGEDLALLEEALAKHVGGEGKVDELDGELLLEVAVDAVSEIDGTHAAAAEELVEGVAVDAAGTGRALEGEDGDEGFFRSAGGEEGAEVGAEGSVTVATAEEQSLTAFGDDAEEIVEDLLGTVELFRIGVVL
jgi:hypothetical protein